MSDNAKLTVVIGFIILAIEIVLLSSSPLNILMNKSFKIGLTPGSVSPQDIAITPNLNLADQAELDKLPYTIGDWESVDDDRSERARERLEADSLLMRTCYKKGAFYQPVMLLVMSSETRSSFHTPIACYKSLGYEIEAEGSSMVPLKDINWIEEENIEQLSGKERALKERTSVYGSIEAHKIIVMKTRDEAIVDRRIVLYFYIKESGLMAGDSISMIRTEAVTPFYGDYNESLEAVQDLMSKTIPYIFRPGEEQEILIKQLLARGTGGYIWLAILLLIPLLLIIIPALGNRNNREKQE